MFVNINCPSYVARHLASRRNRPHYCWLHGPNHNQKLNLLVCTYFSMMSFVFAPAAKNKPNLQNVFTQITLSMTPSPYLITWGYIYVYRVLFLFCFVLCLFFCVFFVFFLLGFSIRCETTVTWDFAKVTKMAQGGKPFFLFGYILMTYTGKN